MNFFSDPSTQKRRKLVTMPLISVKGYVKGVGVAAVVKAPVLVVKIAAIGVRVPVVPQRNWTLG